jgi:hypothetical protein
VAGRHVESLDGKATGNDVVGLVVQRFEVDAARAGQDYLDLMETLESIDAVRRCERRHPPGSTRRDSPSAALDNVGSFAAEEGC